MDPVPVEKETSEDLVVFVLVCGGIGRVRSTKKESEWTVKDYETHRYQVPCRNTSRLESTH